MRLPFVLMLVLMLVAVGLDWFLGRVIKRCSAGSHAALCRRLMRVHVCASVVLTIALVVMWAWPKRTASDTTLRTLMWLLYGWFSIYVPKAVFVLAYSCRYIARLCGRSGRSPWWWRVAAILAVLAFGVMWWGALVNRLRVNVVEVTIDVPGLPQAFDGYRIVQISDLHVGTFGSDTSFMARLVDRVNALHPDAVMFTGDIVNRNTGEMRPFMSTLARLHAPDGVYAIFGNHDYGDYTDWPTRADKDADHAELVADIHRLGWHLLLNDTRWLRRGNDSIAIVGVENIGDPPFSAYGSMREAYPTIGDDKVKILLTHNPAHWTDSIADCPEVNIALSLSGHTHAMQMEAFGLSPAAFRYRTWGGLYADRKGQQLYVNIGAGTVGIPARIGATPEITVLTLRRKQ